MIKIKKVTVTEIEVNEEDFKEWLNNLVESVDCNNLEDVEYYIEEDWESLEDIAENYHNNTEYTSDYDKENVKKMLEEIIN